MQRPQDHSKPLATLRNLPRDVLNEQWIQAFGHPAPARVHKTLLISALAWHLQMKAQKVWTPAKIHRMLDQASGGKVLIQPGTRLVREWQGRHYQVTVLHAGFGFEFEGKTYKSLTAITREITGISWSGPKFFGLKK